MVPPLCGKRIYGAAEGWLTLLRRLIDLQKVVDQVIGLNRLEHVAKLIYYASPGALVPYLFWHPFIYTILEEKMDGKLLVRHCSFLLPHVAYSNRILSPRSVLY